MTSDVRLYLCLPAAMRAPVCLKAVAIANSIFISYYLCATSPLFSTFLISLILLTSFPCRVTSTLHGRKPHQIYSSFFHLQYFFLDFWDEMPQPGRPLLGDGIPSLSGMKNPARVWLFRACRVKGEESPKQRNCFLWRLEEFWVFTGRASVNQMPDGFRNPGGLKMCDGGLFLQSSRKTNWLCLKKAHLHLQHACQKERF